MNIKFLIGLAAGIGVTYFFTSKKGQEFLEDIRNSASDLLEKGEESFSRGKERAEKYSNLTEKFVIDQF